VEEKSEAERGWGESLREPEDIASTVSQWISVGRGYGWIEGSSVLLPCGK
jgi:hypothetical protein